MGATLRAVGGYNEGLPGQSSYFINLIDENQRRMEARVMRALRGQDHPHDRPHSSSPEGTAPDGFINMTEKDREVLQFLLQGLSDKEIADRLHCSVRTVSNRVSSLLKRSGQPSRGALIAYWGQQRR